MAPDDRLNYLCSAVDELSQRSWFSRLWVYQEAASARSIEVYSGFHHVPWDYFDSFSDPGYQRFTPSDFEIISKCRRLRQFDPCNLILLLVILGSKQCEEEQDRIFAIRSVAFFEHIESLQPDYTVAPTDLYRRVVLECLERSNADRSEPSQQTTYLNQNAIPGLPLPHVSLLLALAGTYATDQGEAPDRPSWVPAFHKLTHRSLAKYYEYSWHLGQEYLKCEPPLEIYENDWRFKSKAPLKAQVKVQHSLDAPDILRIRGSGSGIVIKVLEHSESPFAYEFDKNSYGTHDTDSLAREAIVTWMSRCAKFSISQGNVGIRAFKELMYCASVDAGFDVDVYSRILDLESKIRGITNHPLDRDMVSESLLYNFSSPLREDHERKLRYYDDFRNLAYVRAPHGHGLIGWIPQSAVEGDVVTFFEGCPRAFVLRPQVDGTFKLLGDSWILGVPDSISLHIPEGGHQWYALS